MKPEEKDEEKKTQMSQYNTSFNMHYDVILQQLANHLFQNETIESNYKYSLANFCILRTLFDYVDEVIEDYPYTAEQLVLLIEEHNMLKTKFEQKLLVLAGEKEEKYEKVMTEIESE